MQQAAKNVRAAMLSGGARAAVRQGKPPFGCTGASVGESGWPWDLRHLRFDPGARSHAMPLRVAPLRTAALLSRCLWVLQGLAWRDTELYEHEVGSCRIALVALRPAAAAHPPCCGTPDGAGVVPSRQAYQPPALLSHSAELWLVDALRRHIAPAALRRPATGLGLGAGRVPQACAPAPAACR